MINSGLYAWVLFDWARLILLPKKKKNKPTKSVVSFKDKTLIPLYRKQKLCQVVLLKLFYEGSAIQA